MRERIQRPLEEWLAAERHQGRLLGYSFSIEMDEDLFAQGILDLFLELDVGGEERIRLRIEAPQFRPKG